MSDTWCYIIAAVLLGAMLLHAKFNVGLSERLEGGHNVGGKFLYKVSKIMRKLGIKEIPDIVEVKYLGTVSGGSRRGGFRGAMLGGFLYGDIGAAIGGLTPVESKSLCRFAVRYDNGKVVIVDCPRGSARYVTYMRYVRWDDL